MIRACVTADYRYARGFDRTGHIVGIVSRGGLLLYAMNDDDTAYACTFVYRARGANLHGRQWFPQYIGIP